MELVIAMIMVAFLVIYYLDRYNIPTILNLGMNIDKNWLSFIGNYITVVISAAIGALVTVWTAIYQIKKTMKKLIGGTKKI